MTRDEGTASPHQNPIKVIKANHEASSLLMQTISCAAKKFDETMEFTNDLIWVRSSSCIVSHLEVCMLMAAIRVDNTPLVEDSQKEKKTKLRRNHSQTMPAVESKDDGDNQL